MSNVKERIAILLRLLGYEFPTELAAAIEVEKGTFAQQLRRNKMTEAVADKVATHALKLGVSTTSYWLRKNEGEPPSKISVTNAALQIDSALQHPTRSPNGHRSISGDVSGPANLPSLGGRDLRVFNSFDSGGGFCVLSETPVKEVPRPHNVIGVSDAFGVYVTSSLMEPAYAIGDMLCISPEPPPSPDIDVVLLTGLPGGKGVRSALRRLVSFTETHWTCKLLANPGKTERLDRQTWPLAYRIAARFPK